MGAWIGGFVLVLVLGVGGVFAVAAWFLHDRIGDKIGDQVCERSRPIVYVVGALFAVTAALTVVAAWDRLDTADQAIADEASAAIDLYWYAHSLDDPAGAGIENRLRDYTGTVVENEWRLMREDQQLSEQAAATLDRLRADLENVEPATTGQSDRYADALTRAGDLVTARQERLEHTKSEIPRLVWLLLVISGVLVLVVPVAFGAPDRLVHAGLAFAAAGVVTFVLVVVADVNHPFSGATTTDLAPFQEARATFDRIDASP